MQRDVYLGWMRRGNTGRKTHSDQLSRIRRLESAFGDLDAAFDADGMFGVLRALRYSKADATNHKALPTGIVSDGEPAKTMATLRHAANQYLKFKAETSVSKPFALRMDMSPLRTPKNVPYRSLKPTGYWLFSANPSMWNVNAWAREREDKLLYYVGKDDRTLVQVGDLVLIKRNVWRGERSDGVSQLERSARGQTLEVKERTSKYIERGPDGARVKEVRGHRCQICLALGLDPVAFQNPLGVGYSEAHHVMPVAYRVPGSLAPTNIMVLCPNHHRQAHYGRFEVLKTTEEDWLVRVDDNELTIEKTRL